MARAWDASQIKFIINSLGIDSGRADGTFLEVAQENPDVSFTPSVDGGGTFNVLHNTYTVCKLTMLQTASGNSVLSVLHIASKKAGGIQYPVYLEDTNGTSKGAAVEAMILKTPDETFAKEAGTVVWEVGVKDIERFVGGH
jgi:hypothetical protein